MAVSSAEDALDKAFLNMLKGHSDDFHKRLLAVYQSTNRTHMKHRQLNVNGELKCQFDLVIFPKRINCITTIVYTRCAMIGW